MIHEVFSVYDKKAKAFITPFFLPTVGMAVRAFTDAVNQEGHAWNKHPEDYQLFKIGQFDDSNGVVTPEISEPVISAQEVLA